MSASKTSPIRLAIGRLPGLAIGLGAYVLGTVTGRTETRFHGLRAVAELSLAGGKNAKADSQAQELLELAEKHPENWDYGNAIHHGNLIRGRVALRGGDVVAAERFLRAAGQTPGSPQLKSFGPNMQLAAELLAAGAREAVLEYLEDCKAFWEAPRVPSAEGPRSPSELLDSWAADVREGRSPDFGANLGY
jgi:hypothetical protein